MISEMTPERRASGYVPQIPQSDILQEGERSGIRRSRIPQQREAHVVIGGPFWVLRNGRDYPFGNACPGEHFQDLALRKEGIAEGQLDGMWMPFGQERPSNARRPPPSQSELFSDRQMRDARQDDLFGKASHLRRRRRKKAQTHQVEQVELTHER